MSKISQFMRSFFIALKTPRLYFHRFRLAAQLIRGEHVAAYEAICDGKPVVINATVDGGLCVGGGAFISHCHFETTASLKNGMSMGGGCIVQHCTVTADRIEGSGISSGGGCSLCDCYVSGCGGYGFDAKKELPIDKVLDLSKEEGEELTEEKITR